MGRRFLRRFRATGRVVDDMHAVHLRGGVTLGRPLRLRMIKTGPMRGVGPIVHGVYGLSTVRMISTGTSKTSSFVVKAARFTIPLNGVVSISTRVTHVRTRLGRGRNFLRKILGGLDGRGFMGGTPTTIVRVRHGGRTSTRDVVRSLGRDVTSLGGMWSPLLAGVGARECSGGGEMPFFMCKRVIVPLFPLGEGRRAGRASAVRVPLPPSCVIKDYSFPTVYPCEWGGKEHVISGFCRFRPSVNGKYILMCTPDPTGGRCLHGNQIPFNTHFIWPWEDDDHDETIATRVQYTSPASHLCQQSKVSYLP